MNLDQLDMMIDSLSNIITGLEEQLRTTVQPTYSPPEHIMPIDTSLRTRVPEHFNPFFSQQPKDRKQSAIQNAIVQARSQKDRVAGLIQELTFHNRQTWRYKIAWHEKFTMPFACFIFFFIGAPLGAIIRKGGLGTPIIIAVLFFVFYYVISMIGERSAREGAMTPLEGIWMSTFIIFATGVFLTFMATKDSSIFNQELYVSYIKKGLNFIFVTDRMERSKIEYQATQTELEPESIISKLEGLSKHCKWYLEGDFKKHLRFSKIWYENEDRELAEIGQRYDHIVAILKQLDVEMIKETVDEYPIATLHNFKIKKISNFYKVAAAVIFPVWLYLFLKVLIQKYSLRNELINIMGANRNLINELKLSINQDNSQQ